MNPENVKQIIETIKTLNINFNDATTQKIAEAVIPVVKLFFLKELISTVIWSGVVIFFILLAYKLFVRMIDSEKETSLKRIEKGDF